MTEKFNLYQEHGVLEYWVVEPFSQRIDLFSLDKDLGKYRPAEYFDRNDTITPTIFLALAIKLEEIFQPFEDEANE